MAVIRGLLALAEKDEDNQEILHQERGIPAIIGAMQAHLDSCDLQSASCMVML
eukprot:COSAG02_NODE_1289_length_13445_cov_16.898322_5_plen_53_part_00